MKTITLWILAILSSTIGLSQDTNIIWQQRIGGTDFDWGRDMDATSDGGYILAGDSMSDMGGDKSEDGIGEEDYWVVKINAAGTIEWDKTIGGSDRERLRSVIQTSDGGYLLGGDSRSNISGNKTENAIGSWDYWIVKLDSSGNVVWDNTLGGTESETLREVRETNDGGYIMVGRSDSDASADKSENLIGGATDYWVVKVNSVGVIEWENTIGGTGFDFPFSVAVLADDTFMIAGYSSSSDVDKTTPSMGGTDGWMVRLDSDGSILWDASFGASGDDRVYCMDQTSDGGYLINAWSDSDASGDKTEDSESIDYWVVKLDALGQLEWENTIVAGDLDEPYTALALPNGESLVGGYSRSGVGFDRTDAPNGGDDIWLVRLDENGQQLSDQSIGGSDNEQVFRMENTSDGAVILFGYTESPVSGDVNDPGPGGRDFWVVKYGNVLSAPSLLSSSDIRISPNPVNTQLKISFPHQMEVSFLIYSVTGAVVAQGAITLDQPIDVSGLHSGNYLIEIISDSHSITKRFIKR